MRRPGRRAGHRVAPRRRNRVVARPRTPAPHRRWFKGFAQAIGVDDYVPVWNMPYTDKDQAFSSSASSCSILLGSCSSSSFNL